MVSKKKKIKKTKKKKIVKPKFQSFQDTILNLQKYWGKQGCVIWVRAQMSCLMLHNR